MLVRLPLLTAISILTLRAAEPVVTPAPTPVAVPVTQPADPLAALPPTTRVILRLTNRARTQDRWAESPFPALLATRWGLGLVEEGSKRPNLFQLVAQLALADHAVIGVDFAGEAPMGHILATLQLQPIPTAPAPPDHLVVALKEHQAQVLVEGPRLQPSVRATLPLQPYRLEGAFRQGGPGPSARWAWDDLLPLPAAELATAPSLAVLPEADAELIWSQRASWAPAGALCHATWTIERFGLREQLRVAHCPALKAGTGTAVFADRTVFSGLPPATIWALSCGHLPTLLARVPAVGEALVGFTTSLGLGTWEQLEPQLGSALIRVEQGAPLPALTIELAMPQETGDAVLKLLDEKQQFSADADGTHQGALGFVPVQAAWRDGRLVITTLGGGIAAALARPGGFLTQPGVSEALKQLPPGDLLLAGLSRSDESWSAVTALAPWLMRRNPALASLSTDLRKAGSFGFIGLRRDGDALIVDAGGLCGGPLSASALVSGFLRLSFPRDGERRPRPEQAPQPEKPQPEEKPKQIEF